MAEIERSLRYRINISTSVKGVKTYDCTLELAGPVEMTPYPNEKGSQVSKNLQNTTLELSDSLVAELDKRYPAPVEGVK